MMVIVTTVLTVLKNIECRCRCSTIVEMIDGTRPIRTGWTVYRENHKKDHNINIVCFNRIVAVTIDIVRHSDVNFYVVSSRILKEISLSNYWLSWTRFEYFSMREVNESSFVLKFTERPRYVLSSTTIVITTSPSSTRALRPLVPLY